jgi:hypothetical protein
MFNCGGRPRAERFTIDLESVASYISFSVWIGPALGINESGDKIDNWIELWDQSSQREGKTLRCDFLLPLMPFDREKGQ